MNMVKLRDMILCDNFIMLIDRKFQEKIFLKGPIVVKVKNGTSNQVTGYYSRKSLWYLIWINIIDVLSGNCIACIVNSNKLSIANKKYLRERVYEV